MNPFYPVLSSAFHLPAVQVSTYLIIVVCLFLGQLMVFVGEREIMVASHRNVFISYRPPSLFQSLSPQLAPPLPTTPIPPKPPQLPPRNAHGVAPPLPPQTTVSNEYGRSLVSNCSRFLGFQFPLVSSSDWMRNRQLVCYLCRSICLASSIPFSLISVCSPSGSNAPPPHAVPGNLYTMPSRVSGPFHCFCDE